MLKIYNTLDRELEEFKPIEEGKVRFYHCGPTVYWTQHIGNMRAVVMADLINRSLRYLGYEVEFVRNYTDVGHLTSDGDEGEDKMEKGVKREGLNPKQIADKYIAIYDHDLQELNTLSPDARPRATEYVQQMIDMVQLLINKGFAYVTPQAVYFDISKAKDYTKLSGQKLELNQQGAGHGDIEDLSHKHNPADFAVWFFRTGAHKNAIQYWPSPFSSSEVENGEGFPGWHIECSAMSKDLLGDTLDIHMGGVEHIPVHHTNEIAQSEAANGVKFVNYWIHNEHLNVNDRKMAKSEGTGFSLAEVEEKGFDPLALRYFFLQAHYRSKQNFTWEALQAASTAYQRMRSKVVELSAQVGDSAWLPAAPDGYKAKFTAAIEDDFNIPQALAVAWDVLKSDLEAQAKLGLILDFDQVLGLKLETAMDDPREAQVPEAAQKLIEERNKARENKDWQKADRIRDQLANEFNIEVKDS